MPGATCGDEQGEEYAAGARMFRSAVSESSNGFMAYTHTGVGAVRGEAAKRRSWDGALGRWGQARVTGHEATRGTEQDRQIGTLALSRPRKLAKRRESS